MNALLAMKIVPVLNGNDVVAPSPQMNLDLANVKAMHVCMLSVVCECGGGGGDGDGGGMLLLLVPRDEPCCVCDCAGGLFVLGRGMLVYLHVCPHVVHLVCLCTQLSRVFYLHLIAVVRVFYLHLIAVVRAFYLHLIAVVRVWLCPSGGSVEFKCLRIG